MADEEMVIFTRTFDLLSWLLPASKDFPRAYRHTFTQRTLDAAFDLRERLEEANARKGRERLAQLRLADEALSKLRVYLRLAERWQWLSPGQCVRRQRVLQRIRGRNGFSSVAHWCSPSSGKPNWLPHDALLCHAR